MKQETKRPLEQSGEPQADHLTSFPVLRSMEENLFWPQEEEFFSSLEHAKASNFCSNLLQPEEQDFAPEHAKERFLEQIGASNGTH